MVRQTSLLSYNEFRYSVLADSQAKVYNMLNVMVEATDRELTDALGYADPNRVRPRRKELCDMGLVGEAGKRECSITGKMAIVWKCL